MEEEMSITSSTVVSSHFSQNFLQTHFFLSVERIF